MSHTLPLRPLPLAELPDVMYAAVPPEPLNKPYWVAANPDLLADFGLTAQGFQTAANLAYLSGSADGYSPPPVATAYAGHQFGVYTPKLGDGRALLIGEAADSGGRLWQWQLKGAGKTPYSRFADGRAVLRSSVREYLCSEAMHGLGIPTTRALALCASADPVYRERQENAAVLTRLAPDFLRFGHFEYLFYTGRSEGLQQLADYLIRRHYPDCAAAASPYAALLQTIIRRTAGLIAAWQGVGFCHGVMNTDNMSALGLTIDYGPFAFLDAYDRRHVANRSDKAGRYAYHAQPYAAHWNVAALAACFAPLLAVGENEADALAQQWPQHFQTAYLAVMRRKLGLQTEHAGDAALAEDLFAALHGKGIDFTLFFRRLSLLTEAHADPVPAELLSLCGGSLPPDLALWIGRYRQRLRAENSRRDERAARMNRANPLYILRNHLAQQAVAAAEAGDFAPIERLRRCLVQPYDEQPEFADFAEAPPAGTPPPALSCSS